MKEKKSETYDDNINILHALISFEIDQAQIKTTNNKRKTDDVIKLPKGKGQKFGGLGNNLISRINKALFRHIANNNKTVNHKFKTH